MTDNEIIKALECCSKNTADCYECPLQNKWSCDKVLGKNALDLINRQKAEIERLEKSVKVHNAGIIHYKSLYKNAKSEAIKEFAERLTDIICENVNRSLDNPDGDNYYPIDVYKDIDNLVKEMAGEE